MRAILDKIDRKLVKLLSNDARDGANQIAERMELSPPTVRGRLKSLIERNLFKIAGLVNVAERPELVVAILGIHANGKGRLNEFAQRMSELPFVTSVSIVTGRYDLICEVMFEGDMEELYRVTSVLLPALAEPGFIQGSETFVVMKSHNKWLTLPKGVWENDFSDKSEAEQAERQMTPETTPIPDER